jgi:tryptophan synthase alpha chain
MKTLTTMLCDVKSAGRMGLMTHVVVGYPTLETTYELIATMVEAGVDAIELQIPFSDPMADGSTIMHASAEALRQGITPRQCLDFLARVSQDFPVAFIVMTYYNLVHSFGADPFLQTAAAAGAAGVIVPDISIDTTEGQYFYHAAKTSGLPVITVLSPQNYESRLAQLAPSLETLVYLPLHKGVTGARAGLQSGLEDELLLLRRHTKVAVVVGFGVSNREQVRTIRAAGADMVVLGSAVIDSLREGGVSAVQTLLETVRTEL